MHRAQRCRDAVCEGRGQASARHDGLDWMRTPRLDDPQAGCKARFAAQEQRERVRIDRGAVDLASADEPDRLDMRAGLAEHPKEWGATDVAEPAQKIEIAAPRTGIVEGPGPAAKVLEPERGTPLGNDDVREVGGPTLGARIVEDGGGCKKPHGGKLELGHPDDTPRAEKPQFGPPQRERVALTARGR